MNPQDFLTNINIAYTLLMIAVIILAGFIILTSKTARKRR